MKKAASIRELANNLIPENFLNADDENVYVPIYDKILKLLRDSVLEDQVDDQVFLIAGQAGTGKTTALNFFSTSAVEKQYHVKYINMRQYLDLSDVDIIDFLLAFAFALVRETSLENQYYKRLEKLKKQHEGELIESTESQSDKAASTGTSGGITVGGGFLNFIKLKADFFANMRLDSVYRHTTREVFKPKKPLLRDLVNQVIDLYIEKEAKGKPLLVIIDDLDKLRSVTQIGSLFLENRDYIFKLSCKKIISIPTHLMRAPEISNFSPYPIRQFVIGITPNPFARESETEILTEEKNKIKKNRELLSDVIRKRIAGNVELIDPDALEKAIDYSGGILRQLIKIVHGAVTYVRAFGGEQVSLSEIMEAIGILRNNMAGTITSSVKIELLHNILRKSIPPQEDSEQFIQMLISSNVLSYENGDPGYEVNPLIKETVRVYAARLQD